MNDPDALSTHTYSIGCPEFDIEKNTGELILAVDYDLDKSSNPSNVTCVVTVSDGDLIGTATVAITINDVNDNAPFLVFHRTLFTCPEPQHTVFSWGQSVQQTETRESTVNSWYYTSISIFHDYAK